MGRKDIHIDGKNTRFSETNQPESAGRPKGVPNTATRLQKFLNAQMRGKHPTTGEEMDFTVAEAMDLQQIAKALKGDTAAWEKILDRLEGKAKQTTELTGADGGAIEFSDTSELTVEEKRALLKLTKARGNVSTDAKHNAGGTSGD